MSRPAVFLDRDGTIVREANYLRSPEELRLLPHAADAIRRLNEIGFAVVMATNQSAVARGLLSEDDLAQVHRILEQRLARRGAHLDRIYYCPHHPTAGRGRYRRKCSCRKPAPGMLLRAARELDLDLSRCFAVGDSLRDLVAGREVGCRTILVRSGYGRRAETESGDPLPADYVVDDLAAAVDWIVEQHGTRSGR